MVAGGATALPLSIQSMSLRLTIHPKHVDSLASHISEQGFPVTRAHVDALDVLFPGSPEIFAAATELDLWEARGGCSSTLVIERLSPPLGGGVAR
jgi:hypothetical protein